MQVMTYEYVKYYNKFKNYHYLYHNSNLNIVKAPSHQYINIDTVLNFKFDSRLIGSNLTCNYYY